METGEKIVLGGVGTLVLIASAIGTMHAAKALAGILIVGIFLLASALLWGLIASGLENIWAIMLSGLCLGLVAGAISSFFLPWSPWAHLFDVARHDEK